MKPEISIVIPTRDRGYLIKESIDSVLEQTYSNWELIIIDDNSKEDDDTEKIVMDYKDQRIKYYRLPEHHGAGQSAARNYGNLMAEAPYIMVADSDDINTPIRVEKTLEAFKQSNCDVVYGELVNWYPETDETLPRHSNWASREFNLEDFKKFNFVPHAASAYKRQLAHDFPYNPFFKRAADYDFYSRLANYGVKFCFVNEIFLKVRKHEGSISRQLPDKYYTDMIKFARGWTNEKPEL